MECDGVRIFLDFFADANWTTDISHFSLKTFINLLTEIIEKTKNFPTQKSESSQDINVSAACRSTRMFEKQNIYAAGNDR